MITPRCIEGKLQDLSQKAYDLSQSCSIMDKRCQLEVADKSDLAAQAEAELIEEIELAFEKIRELESCSIDIYKLLEKCEDDILRRVKNIRRTV